MIPFTPFEEDLGRLMPEGEVFWIVEAGPPPLVRLEYAFRPADRTWTWTLIQPGTPDGLATWILPVVET